MTTEKLIFCKNSELYLESRQKNKQTKQNKENSIISKILLHRWVKNLRDLITFLNFTHILKMVNSLTCSIHFMLFEVHKARYCIFINAVRWIIQHLKHSDSEKSKVKLNIKSFNVLLFPYVLIFFFLFFLEKVIFNITESTKPQNIDLVINAAAFRSNNCHISISLGLLMGIFPPICLSSHLTVLWDCVFVVGTNVLSVHTTMMSEIQTLNIFIHKKSICCICRMHDSH